MSLFEKSPDEKNHYFVRFDGKPIGECITPPMLRLFRAKDGESDTHLTIHVKVWSNKYWREPLDKTGTISMEEVNSFAQQLKGTLELIIMRNNKYRTLTFKNASIDFRTIYAFLPMGQNNGIIGYEFSAAADEEGNLGSGDFKYLDNIEGKENDVKVG